MTPQAPSDLRFGRNLEPRAQRGETISSTTLRYHFENIFTVPNKIIHLINKQGFLFRWRWLVLCRLRRCSGETRCRIGRVPWWKGVGHASDTRIGGRNIHQLLFRRSKHCKQLRQSSQQRNKQKNLIGVEFLGCYIPPPSCLVFSLGECKAGV